LRDGRRASANDLREIRANELRLVSFGRSRNRRQSFGHLLLHALRFESRGIEVHRRGDFDTIPHATRRKDDRILSETLTDCAHCLAHVTCYMSDYFHL
jgi:hypothetical protein